LYVSQTIPLGQGSLAKGTFLGYPVRYAKGQNAV
jgi:hypothetical protein